MKKKIGRNEPCPCGSGKKFKKCCESTMIAKKYMAHKIESSDQISSKIASLSSLISPPILDNIKAPEIKISDSTKEVSNKEKDLVKPADQPKDVSPKKVAKKSTKALKKTTKKKATPESS